MSVKAFMLKITFLEGYSDKKFSSKEVCKFETVCSCCGSSFGTLDINPGLEFTIDPKPRSDEDIEYWFESVKLSEEAYLNIRHREDIPFEVEEDED